MKTIGGQPILNSAQPLRIQVTPQDIDKGNRREPNSCAVARAAVRQVKGATAAKAHLGNVYLKINGQWRRFRTPKSMRDEIIAFDRGGKMLPGEFDLLPISTASLVRRVAWIRGEPSKGGTRNPRKAHRTAGVRAPALKDE